MNLLRAFTDVIAPVRRNLIWFLLATYVLAALLPGPGEALRRVNLGELPFSSETFNPTHLLLAILLFCVGVSIRSDEARNVWRLTHTVLGSLLGSWFVPTLALLLMGVTNWCGVSGTAWESFLLGAILVVAMPPANSSSVWSELSGGRAAATVTVIILGTLLTPLIAPLIVGFFSRIVGAAGVEIPPSTDSLLEVLFAFVMLPAALGVAVRSLLDATLARWIDPLMELTKSVALVSLLILNYGNAATAMPQLTSARFPANALLVVVLTMFLSVLVFGIALAVSQAAGLRGQGARLSFVYVTGMKNTGAALVLASSLLSDRPLAILVPVIYTLSQHLAAAILDRLAAVRRTQSLTLMPEVDQASTPSY
mgnify:CR=1 FL=1